MLGYYSTAIVLSMYILSTWKFVTSQSAKCEKQIDILTSIKTRCCKYYTMYNHYYSVTSDSIKHKHTLTDIYMAPR